MYLNVSRYKKYTRVRILEKALVGGKRITRLVEHVGSARNETELAILRLTAEERLSKLRPQPSLLDTLEQRLHDPARLAITHSYAYGLWHIVGGLYDKLGLPDNLLKYLVLARIALPKSKLSTTRYLENNLNRVIDVQSIYDYMDTLKKDSLMPHLLDHAQKQAKQRTGQAIAVVFYDVTTLYFETDEEDEDTTEETGLRKKGYSKDHRYDLPQVVIGLTVDGSGFPLDFQVYEGNTYEGHTLIEGIASIQAKLSLKPSDLTVIADAGMLSQTNIDALEESGYVYIVGARIKSLNKNRTEELLNWNYAKQGMLDVLLDTSANRHLIVSYSDKRAKRSKQNRDRLVKKLQSKLDHGQVVKKSKYIFLHTADNTTTPLKPTTFTGSIDQEKIDQDARFDGLKGYVTNTALTAEEVVARYANLWTVEKSFRMSKSDLRTRPVFHFKRRRILAHLLICVCSLAVLREFEQKIVFLKPAVGLSVALEQVLSIRQYTLTIPNQPAAEVYSQLTPIQEQLLRL
jgi:transposase